MHRIEKALRIFADPRLWKAARWGVAAGVEHAQMLTDLPHRTVIDVGANRGQFALAVKRYSPQAQIKSFEPVPAAARVFRRVFQSDPSVSLVQIALGSCKAKDMMNVANREDSSSFLIATDLQRAQFPGSDTHKRVQVNIDTLDSQFENATLTRPVLLKLDVEGYELQVLKGGRKTLEAVDFVLVEIALVPLLHGQAGFPDIYRLLHDKGFDLRGVFNNIRQARSGLPVRADFLFERGSDQGGCAR